MNAICGVFLYVMPELDAFYCFEKFMKHVCPVYAMGDLTGYNNRGVPLFKECFEALDKPLCEYLNKHLTPHLNSKSIIRIKSKPNYWWGYVYAFAPIQSFCTSIPRLSELLQLWDFMLAFGAHLNIIILIAQYMLQRDNILNCDGEANTIKKFIDATGINIRGTRSGLPDLDAKKIISLTCYLIKMLPSELYDRLVEHTKLQDSDY